MKRFLAIAAITASLMANAMAQGGADYDALGRKLDEYISAIAAESAAAKSRECDFLISTCRDSLVRQFTALKLYDHYVSSKLMGDDAVAVHLADEWFIPGKVSMKSEIDLINARVFAEFNRSSLIGMKAPVLKLKDLSMQDQTIFGGDGSEGWTVLYFYDTSCSTCRLESPRLRDFMNSAQAKDLKMRLIAVYTGDDEAAWARYRVTSLAIDGALHLWDPGMDSGFQKLYGILSTPRMFLIAPDGTIEGRGLDTTSLRTLMDAITKRNSHVWGGNDAMALFDGLFSSYGDTLKVSHVLETAELIENRTIEKGDTISYRNLEGDLLYYMYSRRDEAFKEAAGPFIAEYIEGRDVWQAQDSADVLSLAGMMRSLWELNPVGEKVADMTLSGTLLRRGRSPREGRFRTTRLRGRESWLIFYTDGCNSCEETLEQAKAISSERRKKVLLVNMDALFGEQPQVAQKALESFDLSLLPHILVLDRRGFVRRRYVTFDK